MENGPASETPRLSATFGKPDQKKHSVKFEELPSATAHLEYVPTLMGSVYIKKDALEELGNPSIVRITIEPLE